MAVKISIQGATAYTSRELIRLLLQHPEAEIIHLGGRREGNPPISSIFTELRGRLDMRLSGMTPDDLPEPPDIVFFTLPHGVSREHVRPFLDAGLRCIDFSADYRFDDLAAYEEWYGQHTDPEGAARSVYGLPELFRHQIASADIVGVPGCYPTGTCISTAPFLKAGLLDPKSIIVDAKSGVSGRGNKPSEGSMYCECNEDVKAYAVGGHRHEPEIEEALSKVSGLAVDAIFTPHLVPMDRGILSTVHARLAGEASAEQLQSVLEEAYADEPFVRVLPAGEQPRTKDVTFTNMVDVAVTLRKGDRVVITSAIDNLTKGAAGAAVQCMNCMLGLPETAGLK
jgi:N-acetyl-gamma-glutamyl-phosphate reductase